MPDFVWRWCIAWLERRGLKSVASVMELRAAKGGSINAMQAVARRALNAGDHVAALAAIEQAVSLAATDPALWCLRGVSHRMAGAFDDALADYQHALHLNARYVPALCNLGEWHLARGSAEPALASLNDALLIDPDYYEARVNRVAALIELGRFDEARAHAERLISDEPLRPEPYGNLGNILVQTGNAKDAVKQYKCALERRTDYPEAHFNLAILLGTPGDQKLAITYLQSQIAEKGESTSRMTLLATARLATGELTSAKLLSQRVLATHPENIAALVTLASCLSAAGDSAAARPIFERVVELDPKQSAIASTTIFELNYQGQVAREELFQRHIAWASRYETRLLARPAFDDRDRDPGRKLKIGYVSGDFFGHPVGFLLRDILRAHDRVGFEIHCFSTMLRSDEVTAEIREAADAWEDVFLQGDEEVATLIQNAEIDILVDLSGHTAYNRLLAFALRPAPIQATWLGYFHSSGMSSIDYFITDPSTTPVGGGQLFSETPVYVPHTRFCFDPPEYSPEVATPPAAENEIITFGSFNRMPKLTDEVIAVWVRILQALPSSRMLLKAGALTDAIVREQTLARFERHGIGSDRLDLREGSGHAEMLAEYGDVDIALDTFPFNGGMTTLEALWMGVPVVTIAGDTVVSRQSVSALANIGLAGELAFESVDAYVEGAVALASNPVRLAELRAQIRPRMAASPLRQSDQFARDLEVLYRRMWQAWCRGEKLPDATVSPGGSGD